MSQVYGIRDANELNRNAYGSFNVSIIENPRVPINFRLSQPEPETSAAAARATKS